ncbi:MAG TPA: hypothetical protein VG722_08660 [Tepidisphaeraceae bacterium]|nr:hypothetical protein [Tepidisphaeraceae bacterium]
MTSTAKQGNRATRSASARNGTILVFYLLLLGTIITGTVTAMAVLSVSQTQGTSIGFQRDEAFYAAEAGIQQAVWNINHNASSWLSQMNANSKQWPTVTLNNNSTYYVKCTSDASKWPGSPMTLQCIGTSANGTVTSQASVMVTETTKTTGGGDGTTSHGGYAPAFAMSGADNFSGSLNIVGSFESTGSFSGSGNIVLTNAPGQGNASLMALQSYNASGSFTVPGDLVFNGDVNSSGKITVGGNVRSGGAVNGTGALYVTGNVWAESGLSNGSLNVGGNVQSGGTLSVTGSSSVTGNMLAVGSVTTGGSVTVGGDIQSGGALTSSGNNKITGSVSAVNAINTSGSFKAGGNVQSGSSVSHTGSFKVTGDVLENTQTSSPTAPPSPNLQFTTPTVDTQSISNDAHSVGKVVSSGTYGSNSVFDFSKTPVIEVTGSISLSGKTTVIPPTDGSTPTLLVDGNMTVSGSFGSSGTPMKMNIVTTGNYTGSGSDYVGGCLCCGGSMTVSGSTYINGCVVVQNGITGSGNVNISTYVTPPSYVDWQDANAGVGGSNTTTTITVSNFKGPIF